MNNKLLKYINIKLTKLDGNDKNELYSELKDIENFLNIFMQIDNDLSSHNVTLLLQNKNLIERVNGRYGFIDDKTEETLFYLLKLLNEKSPSFNANNYTFILNIIRRFYENEERLYSYYEKLSENYNEYYSFDSEYKKLILETMQANIENEKLIEEEFVDFIVQDETINNSYKLILLKEINKYNKSIVSSHVLLTVYSLKQLLGFYGYSINNTKSLDIISKKYSEGVIKNILNTIKRLDLRFSNEILEKILVYGTSSETIKKAYNKICNDDRIQLISTYDIYNFWINSPYTANTSETISSSVVKVSEEGSVEEITSSSSGDETLERELNNKEINSTEIFKTAEYLKKFPFYNAEFDKMKKILKVSVEKLQKRENLIGLYGINAKDIDGSMTLYSPYIMTMLDQMIELDLYDYILNHLSTLSRPLSLPIVLYKNLKEGTNIVNIKNGNKFFESSVIEQVGKYKDAVKDAGLVDITIDRRGEFDALLDEEGIDKIVPSVFKMPIIKLLEEKYRVNEYQYIIDGYIFSRIKVLRIMSGLNGKLNNLDYDMFLYVMTYGKIMNEKDAKDIQNSLQEVYIQVKNKTKL